MPTKKSAKSGATKKTAPKKPVTKTTVRTVSSDKSTTSSASATTNKSRRLTLDNNIINIVLAELVGTFVLTIVALMTASDIVPLFIGLTFAIIVMAIGGISGAHVNPAVTFGLWASKQLKTIKVPFYWIAQFLGAMAAIVVMNAVANTKLNLSFDDFDKFAWPIFWIELIGTAVFMFGFSAVLRRTELSGGTKALGIGLSLFIGLAVASSIYTPMRSATISNIQNSDSAKNSTITEKDLPHEILVNGATLNPAVALATTETPASTLLGTSDNGDNSIKHYSRLSWEVILATFVGAAAGANLPAILNRKYRD